MATFEEARRLLEESVCRLEPESVRLREALGCVLAQDIYSPVELPLFDSSAMDGYAVRSSDVNGVLPVKLKIAGEVKAGDFKKRGLAKGEAYRIYTGAQIPGGADAVLMQEDGEEAEGFVLVKKHVKSGDNVRKAGEEVRRGELVLNAGALLTPAALGMLAMMGIGRVSVTRKPSVLVAATGSEVMRPGERLRAGKVYDSNTYSISSALRYMGIERVRSVRAKDDPSSIENLFHKALHAHDVLIFTGGVSVGKYDFVSVIFEKAGVKKVFHKVAQKPGKPVYFGKCEDKLIFGLPGNPASALVCFYQYVYPAIRKMSGLDPIFLSEGELVLEENIQIKPGRVHFLFGIAASGSVTPLPHQASHMLSSLAVANCLVVVPAGQSLVKKGESVRVQFLPV
jgi:molybdopterin molybdotransferase